MACAAKVVALALLLAPASAACADKVYPKASCAHQSYDTKAVADSDACCALCASEPHCVQWTFSPLGKRCARTAVAESFRRSPWTLATCGVRKAPAPGPAPGPTPSPSPSGSSSIWAVIAAGSQGFWNYRHQADACHAYQILRKSGVPADQIILMMQDDVAGSSENKFPGKLFNKPGNDSPDVYDGCKVDYRGSEVTAKLFLSVITGDASGVPNGGKVLRSGSSDRVFLNFVDHGGVGIIAFPNGPTLHASELSRALKTMQSKEMFKELLFYMEACESGSMFPDLTDDGKIFAVTAANAKESSWGYYCSPKNDTVNGEHMGTCLGDLFSIAWMEDSDLGKLSTESIREQVRRVTARTVKSHVTTFGDTSFEDEAIGGFEKAVLAGGSEAPPAPWSPESAVNVRDIPLRTAYQAWERAESPQDKARAWERLQAVVAGRKSDDELFERVARKACEGAGFGCAYQMRHAQQRMKDVNCHASLVQVVHEACPRRAEHNPGGWNGFNMKFSQTLVNLCEAQAELRKDSRALGQIVRSECAAASRAAGAAELVI